MQAIEGAPITRTRPALRASRKSAPPRSAALAIMPVPIAAPIRKDFSADLSLSARSHAGAGKMDFGGSADMEGRTMQTPPFSTSYGGAFLPGTIVTSLLILSKEYV